MGKRTLRTCWAQLEKLSKQYLTDEEKREDVAEKIIDLTFKANADLIPEALNSLFVRPHVAQPLRVELVAPLEDGLPDWQTQVDLEEGVIALHPVSVVALIEKMRTLELTDELYEDFLRCRYMSFLIEMGKMPSIFILFLMVLQRVAYLLEIAHLEKRGGVIEVAEGESYHTMLWAFKELESFARRTYGVNVRAQYAISWYESDWITGR
jgi:hypothetical protein